MTASNGRAAYEARFNRVTAFIYDHLDDDIDLNQLAEIISVDHTGSYMQIGKAFDTLYGWLAARNLLTPRMRSIGVFFDDPDSIAEAELHSRAGVILPGDFVLAAPLRRTEIAAGTY